MCASTVGSVGQLRSEAVLICFKYPASHTKRKAMTDASITVRPMGVMYHGLGMVVAAIDALAALLVGRPVYFWAAGGGATEGERNQHRRDLESEAGAKPAQE
jgi:succinyl-CoA synthetase beta subunit